MIRIINLERERESLFDGIYKARSARVTSWLGAVPGGQDKKIE